MGYYTTAEIVKIVNKLIDRCGTRDPYKVAKELGINIIYRNFDKQRGAYKVILKNRFVFLKNGMHPVVEQIVLWHEIGHDVLHRQEAVAVGGFKEFNIFDGSVKNFVALVKNGSFLVRITDMTILIEKEFIYGSSKTPNPTDYYRKQHYQCR